MPQYYVQNFDYDGPGQSKMYGEMPAHDHGQSTQFTVDCKAYLESQGCKNVRATGSFQSKQPKPADGKEMSWNDKLKKWLKS